MDNDFTIIEVIIPIALISSIIVVLFGILS